MVDLDVISCSKHRKTRLL